MVEISNKAISILVITAILISLVGIFMGKEGITGMASAENQTTQVSLYVTSGVDINLTDNSVSFGNMLNEGWNNSETVNDNITAENVGSTIIDVEYWANQSLFVKKNGTTNQNNPSRGDPDESFKIKVLNVGGCSENNVTSYTNATIGFSNIKALVGDCANGDKFTVGFEVYVPNYEPAGSKISTVYFRATQRI